MKEKRPCGCGGVSLRLGQNAGGVNSVCHGFTGGVTSHQGHVVPTPKVVLIYWDQFFTDTPAAVTSMDQFASDLATGNYWDGLAQYGVGAASVQGHAVIDMTTFPTPNSQHPGQAFSESQMQSQLTTWLDKGAVTPKPAGNEENLVYLIFAPTDTTLSLDGQTSGFCGYHEHGKYNASTSRDNLIWATVQGYAKSSTGTDFVNSISFCVSHELSEAFTNPDEQGYFNDNGCEIGDICEASATGPCCITVPYTVAGRTWQVEKYWSNLDSNCIIGPSLTTAANTPIDGYATTFNNQQHVNFIGSDGHVHELVYSDRWGHTDLTQAARAPNPAQGSALDGYQTTFNNQQHVNYIGTDGHVHELVYSDHWGPTDLTQAARAPNPAPGSALDGYQTTFNNQQHVNYIGTDGHVHELVYSDHWGHTDLTQAAKAPNPAPGSPLDGYQTTFNNQQHVNYIGTDGHVHELVYSDHWGHTDLTQAAKAPNPAPGSALDGYQTTFNNQQHVNYIGTDGHVHELVYSDHWGHTDLM